MFVSLKHIQKKNANPGTRTNVVCFRSVVLLLVNGLGYHQLQQKTALSQHPSLAATLVRKLIEL